MGVDERTNKEAFSTVFKWQFVWKSFMMPKSLLNTFAAFLSYFMRYIATTQLHFQKDNFLQGAFFPFEFARVKGCELSLTNAITFTSCSVLLIVNPPRNKKITRNIFGMLRALFSQKMSFLIRTVTVGSGIPLKVTRSAAFAGHGLYHR